MATDMNKMVDKFKALGLGEKIILVAALVLLIDSFLPWYSVNIGSIAGVDLGSVHRNGWESPGGLWSILAVLIGLAMAGVILVKNLAKEGTLPDNISGITWPKIYLGAGAAAALFIVIKIINESSHLGFGFFVGIICVAGLAAGGVLMYRDEMAAGGGSSAGTS